MRRLTTMIFGDQSISSESNVIGILTGLTVEDDEGKSTTEIDKNTITFEGENINPKSSTNLETDEAVMAIRDDVSELDDESSNGTRSY